MVIKKKGNELKAENFYKQIIKEMNKFLGNDTTFANDLQKVAIKFLGSKFRGVFPSDRIPRLNDLKKYAILNLDRSSQPGSHWIGVAYHNGNTIVYDSFGRKTSTIIPSLINSGNGRIIMTDDDAEQKIKENNCGQRVLAWLITFDRLGADMALLI